MWFGCIFAYWKYGKTGFLGVEMGGKIMPEAGAPGPAFGPRGALQTRFLGAQKC